MDSFPFDLFPEAIVVSANAGMFAPFVADHTVALALSAGRDLPVGRQMVHADRSRSALPQRGVYGATAVILGFAAIGREQAHRATALGARILGVNRDGTPNPACERMFAAGRLAEALGLGDFIFEVRPLTRATVRTIGAAELARMRPTTVFVNVGRAENLDEEVLYSHLRHHPAFRAAFDGWWQEDYRKGTLTTRFPLSDLPNFSGTPHSAGMAAGAEPQALQRALENLSRFFAGEPVLHVVNRREYGL